VVADETLEVQRVGRGRSGASDSGCRGRDCQAIEQNPEKPSRWAKAGAGCLKWCSSDGSGHGPVRRR